LKGNISGFVARAKLTPSFLPTNCIDRAIVHKCTLGVQENRVAVVHAQAGYGKSTLLHQLFERLRVHEGKVAWLSLDEFDQQLEQFVCYLLEACVEAEFFKRQQWPEGADSESLQRFLLATLSSCAGNYSIILDDFHRAASDEVVRCINYLIEDLPKNFRMIIGARDLPESLVTADLRLHDELFEITNADLKFSSDDIAAYFGDFLTEGASATEVTQLLLRTEGWPAALQMIRRRLHEAGDIEATLQELTGRSSDLAEYFLEQVFHQLHPEQQEFLVRTSILERVNGDLGNFLCDHSDGWRVLEELERRDFFVSAVDADREWFRYHRLFSEFLHRRLRSEVSHPQRLHARAARWLQKNRYFLEAVQHALASGEKELIAELLESMQGWQCALMGSVGLVHRILVVLDEETIRRFPRVWLASMYLTTRTGRIAETRQQIAQLRAQSTVSGEDLQLASEIEVFSALVDRYGDEFNPEQLKTLEQLGETLPIDNPLLNAVRCNLLCAFYVSSGRYDECLQVGDQAIAHFRACGSVFGEIFIYFHQGFACLQEARLRDAESLFVEGKSLATEQVAGGDLVAIGDAFHALLSCAVDNLSDAKTRLDSALHHIERADGWFEVYAASYEAALTIASAEEDTWQFERIIERALAIARHRQLPRLQQLMHIWRIDRAISASDTPDEEVLATCEAWVRDLCDCQHPLIRRTLVLALVRNLMRIGEDERAAKLLRRELARSKSEGHVLTSISLAILLGCAQWRLGHRAEALEEFEFAVSSSVFEGIKRPFVEEREFLSPIMPHLHQAMSIRRANRLRDMFFTQLKLALESRPRINHRSQDFLSKRERQVLHLLLEGLTYAEMAEDLCLSINTVKFHLKNLYGKLGVNNRREAIQAAARTRLV